LGHRIAAIFKGHSIQEELICDGLTNQCGLRSPQVLVICTHEELLLYGHIM
jgi:hypothetical protein